MTSAVERLRGVIGSRSGDVLVTSTEPVNVATIAAASWAEGRRIVFAPTNQPEVLDAMTSRRGLIALDGTEDASGEPRPPSGAVKLPALPPADAETIIAEFHTSGSTGKPVRVEKNVRQLFGEARFLVEQFGIIDEDVVLSGVPACHLYGFLFSVMIPSVAGCRLVDATPLHPDTITRLADELDATILVSTPTQLRALSAASAIPDLRVAFSSGAPLPARVRSRLQERGLEVTEVFGSTETGGIAWRDGGSDGWWTPFEPVEVRERDGVMTVRSPFLADADADFVTNDLVDLDGDRFRHAGRDDDVVKIGSKRVSKRALHERLLAHEDVTDVAIGEVGGDGQPTRLHAFVTGDGEVSAAALREDLEQAFDPVTVPRLHFVEELPRTALGKISQAEIDRLLRRTDREPQFGTPVSRGDSRWEVTLVIPDDCRYFDGHFDGYPILPGVVQLHLATSRVARIWPELETPVRVQRIKFNTPISPGVSLVLELERSDETVAFRLRDEDDTYCSGSFVYE